MKKKNKKKIVKKKLVTRKPAKKVIKKTVKKVAKYKPTAEQVRALKRKTSFGVKFTRRKAIRKARGANGKLVQAIAPGRDTFVSSRRFGSQKEAVIHGSRFMRIERHRAYVIVELNLKPNAWVNLKTKKTNPLIGAKRTDRS